MIIGDNFSHGHRNYEKIFPPCPLFVYGDGRGMNGRDDRYYDRGPEGARVLGKAAQCDKNVLILGETGTGKDVAAKKIHELGSRARRPFVAVNCASLPEELIEAELFGYARGSFTGAFREKAGLLEVAEEGTVFLDEIGDLPFHLQAKILRVIDNRETRRIGETATRRVGARFIFATNKALDREVRAGKFRKDLYFRINVVLIRLPPLRERREDIPLLAHEFLERENGRTLSQKDLTPGALKRLMAYDFPGNIRELENIIERAFVLSESGIITVDDLKLEGDGLPPGQGRGISAESLRDALTVCRWNKTRTAAEIGKSRRQLYRLLEKHGLDDCIRRAFRL
jgi:transcriptional regulator with GAF, ATPase, and Fis domain